MQCNTNYTGSDENFKYINLNVLKTYSTLFPDVVLGLSDHTAGCVTVLGSVSLGARAIEKHFTDDTTRDGPDHPFSMDPQSWKKMVDDTRLLELALGSTIKKVEENELDTVILQRRAIRVVKNINVGDKINDQHLQFQRPCPKDAISVNDVKSIIGKKLNKAIELGDYLRKDHIQW